MWRAQNGTERTDHHISPPAPARAHVPVRFALSTTRETAGAEAAWSKGDDHLKAKKAVWRAVDEAALFQQTGGLRNAEREKLLVQLWISLSNADRARRQLTEAVLPIPWTKALPAHRAPPAAPTSAPATPLPYNVPYNPPSYSLPAAPPSATLAVSRSPWPTDLSTSFYVAPQTVDARDSTLLSDELRAVPRSVLQALANTYGRTVAAAAAAAAGATAAPTPSAAPNSSSESAGLDLLMAAALARRVAARPEPRLPFALVSEAMKPRLKHLDSREWLQYSIRMTHLTILSVRGLLPGIDRHPGEGKGVG